MVLTVRNQVLTARNIQVDILLIYSVPNIQKISNFKSSKPCVSFGLINSFPNTVCTNIQYLVQYVSHLFPVAHYRSAAKFVLKSTLLKLDL